MGHASQAQILCKLRPQPDTVYVHAFPRAVQRPIELNYIGMVDRAEEVLASDETCDMTEMQIIMIKRVKQTHLQQEIQENWLGLVKACCCSLHF